MGRLWEDHRLTIMAVGALLVGLLMSVYVVPEEE